MDTKETTTYHAVLIAAAVIGTIIFYFIVSVMRQQRRHRLLYKAKLEAEVATLEKERARVAADLHDDLGPTLSAVKFKLSSIDPGNSEDEELIADSLRYIDTTVQQLRQISNGLMPGTLVRKGAIAAIEEFIDQAKAASTLDISFEHSATLPVDASKAIHLYRIIQEIVHNTIKHAHATRLKIQWYGNDTKLIIATADNGCGFNQNAMFREMNGLGLNNLRSRTEILSGELYINTKPGAGTSFTIEIPLAG